MDNISSISWGGITFNPLSHEGAVSKVISLAEMGTPAHVHLCNSWTVVLANDDPAVKTVLSRNDALNLIDGVPLARTLSTKSGKAVSTSRGPSLFEDSIVQLGRRGLRQLFLGSTDEVLDVIRRRLEAEGVSPRNIETFSPPYVPVNEASMNEIRAHVRSVGVSIVWVGMGTPKQDLIAADIASRIDMPAICVGAAFDFYAGSVKEAPRWVQGTGFEWLYRFAAEPRRLWRRYTYGNWKFLRLSRTVD